jgi:hypothetical protein
MCFARFIGLDNAVSLYKYILHIIILALTLTFTVPPPQIPAAIIKRRHLETEIENLKTASIFDLRSIRRRYPRFLR